MRALRLLARTLSIPLLCCASACGAPPAPDVVLITLDTTRVDHLTPYGYARPTSPQLQAFARDAIVFERAWSTSSWTLPAHASLLTGLLPTNHGAHFDTSGRTHLGRALQSDDPMDTALAARVKVNRLPPDVPTLAALLRDRGYATAAFAGGPWLSPEFGLLNGYLHRDADVTDLAGRRADALTDAAIAWLRAIPRDQPVHLLLNYFDPHSPYEPPQGYDDLPAARVPLRVTEADVVRGAPLDADQRRAYVDRYDGEIRFMDEQIGRLFSALRTAGRFDDALIVVAADHGELFGEHAVMGHTHWLYEELLRIPFLVHLPGGRLAGTRNTDPVSLVDAFGLVAREVRLPLPERTDAVALGDRESVLGELYPDPLAIDAYGPKFDRRLFALIRWPWKVITQEPGGASLFDLARDPREENPLSGAHAEIELLAALADARARFAAPEPSPLPEGLSEEVEDRLRELGYVD